MSPEVLQCLADAILYDQVLELFDLRQVEANLRILPSSRRILIDAMLERGPILALGHEAYTVVVHLMRIMLEAELEIVEIEGEVSLVPQLYAVARTYAMSPAQVIIPVCTSLRNEPIFLNVPFWVASTRRLVRQDIDRWCVASSCRVPDFQPLLVMPQLDLFAMFAMNRIHAITASMQYLRAPAAVITEYLLDITELFGFADSGHDIHQRLSSSFVSWLLHVAILYCKTTSIAEKDYSGHIAETLGYSPAQELILTVRERLGNVSLSPVVAATSGDSSDEFFTCICGFSIERWTPIGAHNRGLRSELTEVPHVLCENCCRTLFDTPCVSDGCHLLLGSFCVPYCDPSPPISFEGCFGNKHKRGSVRMDCIAATKELIPRRASIQSGRVAAPRRSSLWAHM